jgi:hypothetical protein
MTGPHKGGSRLESRPRPIYRTGGKESQMLIPQKARQVAQGQGCPDVTFADLRRSLANPQALSEGHRQRLLELSQRLRRVQALGGEHHPVSMSEQAQAALAQYVSV